MIREDSENPYSAPKTPLGPGRRVTGEGLLALLASFTLTSSLGFAFVFRYWSGRSFVDLAWAKALGYVVSMAGVHLAAYMAYRRQRTGLGS